MMNLFGFNKNKIKDILIDTAAQVIPTLITNKISEYTPINENVEHSFDRGSAMRNIQSCNDNNQPKFNVNVNVTMNMNGKPVKSNQPRVLVRFDD